MEPVFVCEFTPTVKMCAHRMRKMNIHRCMIIVLLGIGVFTYTTFTALKFRFSGMWSMLFLASAAYFLWCLFMPETTAVISLKRYKKDSSARGIYKVSFGDAIELSQGRIRVIWEYSEINEIRHLKYSYELIKNKHMIIMLDPTGFNKGTFEEFKQFLREKRPDLTIPE